MSYFERPVLVLFTSMPGSGKSYFARLAAERMGAARLSSDALRIAIFGSLDGYYAETKRLGKRKVLDYIFGAMDYTSEQVLASGHDLIYDTNTNRREYRRAEEDRARGYGAIPITVHLEVPYEVALQRGQEREELVDQRRKTEDDMRELIDRIQADTDPFEDSELVVNLDGQKPFKEQFMEFEAQVKEIIDHGKD